MRARRAAVSVDFAWKSSPVYIELADVNCIALDKR
jgi:hypothetical protein